MKKILLLIASVLVLAACSSGPAPSPERIPARDYQHCLDAEQMGGGDEVQDRCGRLSEEIEHKNQKEQVK
ncbi:lipoprotein [Erwinia sp. ErVv1]|uniref:lipoprotein n=1 Tax=Erwinia sp. ErVv1 TaxID=1603299 RepID=UPI000832AE75|nr:lipoprotein [Erwinia sp. ErVv1]